MPTDADTTGAATESVTLTKEELKAFGESLVKDALEAAGVKPAVAAEETEEVKNARLAIAEANKVLEAAGHTPITEAAPASGTPAKTTRQPMPPRPTVWRRSRRRSRRSSLRRPKPSRRSLAKPDRTSPSRATGTVSSPRTSSRARSRDSTAPSRTRCPVGPSRRSPTPLSAPCSASPERLLATPSKERSTHVRH